MSVYHPPVLARRVEPVILDLLRCEHPDVTFGSLRSPDNPIRECVVVGEPQGPQSPVTQYVRLRVSVWVRRDDMTGDIPAAQHLANDVISTITSKGAIDPIVSAELSNGPIRIADDADPIYMYAIILLAVRTD
jgi:hypothetical protein